MEAESGMNLRRSRFSSTLTNNHNNLYWGLGLKSSQNAQSYSLHPSVSQLLLNTSNDAMAGASFRGGYLPAATPPTQLYSSLPPIPLHQQPPLLPLPMKSATMPSSTKKISVPPPPAIGRSSSTAARQNNHKRKKKQQFKPSTNPNKETSAESAKIEETPKPMGNKPTVSVEKKGEEEEEETEEEILIGLPAASETVSSVCSLLSPPPSSLPLPRLLLMRPRRPAKVAAVAAAASSCIAEAMAGVDAAAATDDLRKLLRL